MGPSRLAATRGSFDRHVQPERARTTASATVPRCPTAQDYLQLSTAALFFAATTSKLVLQQVPLCIVPFTRRPLPSTVTVAEIFSWFRTLPKLAAFVSPRTNDGPHSALPSTDTFPQPPVPAQPKANMRVAS